LTLQGAVRKLDAEIEVVYRPPGDKYVCKLHWSQRSKISIGLHLAGNVNFMTVTKPTELVWAARKQLRWQRLPQQQWRHSRCDARPRLSAGQWDSVLGDRRQRACRRRWAIPVNRSYWRPRATDDPFHFGTLDHHGSRLSCRRLVQRLSCWSSLSSGCRGRVLSPVHKSSKLQVEGYVVYLYNSSCLISSALSGEGTRFRKVRIRYEFILGISMGPPSLMEFL